MSNPQNSAQALFFAQNEVTDPGTTKTIVVDRSPAIVNLVSTTTETRTLGRPTRAGALVTLYCRTAGGNITVTVTGNLNTTGDSTFVFTTAGQWAMFQAVETATAGTLTWRLVSHYAIANQSPSEAGLLDGLLSTAAELDAACDESARNIALNTGGADSTTTITQATHSGKTVTINNATKVATVNLPAATGSGGRYKFFVGTSITAGAGNSISFVATGAHLFGNAWVVSDNSAAVLGYAAGGATSINLDGATKGGIKGDVIEIEDVATSKLQVRAMTQATGTEATPFG